MVESRWTKRIVHSRPRLWKRSAGRPQKHWLDDFRQNAGRDWRQVTYIKNEIFFIRSINQICHRSKFPIVCKKGWLREETCNFAY